MSLRRILADYGMVAVLLLLCGCFTIATLDEQPVTRATAVPQIASRVASLGTSSRVLIAVGVTSEDSAFAAQLQAAIESAGAIVVATVKGQPVDVRRELVRLSQSGDRLDAIACTEESVKWAAFEDLPADFPALGAPQIIGPQATLWPTFLTVDNLINVASQISVIAIMAIGMTIVIITGGIDLSVGSLVALSAVVSTWLIRELFGGLSANSVGMATACVAGVAVTGLVGIFSGAMITKLAVPPFIVTLAMMLVASGLAFMLSDGESVYHVPDSFTWLGREADLFGLPNSVLLMLVLYLAAQVLMTRTVLGRHFYCVGGNRTAAWLSGVPVDRVLMWAYVISALLAGLGGVVIASQLKSGSPSYGAMYELYVIAAVVVGGTSLSGGEGRMFGTLIGAFIIAVIQNGMNLTNIGSYAQKVVLGFVILGAVILDRLRRRPA